MAPSLSILTPTYRAAEFLPTAVRSVQHADREVEHVIVDGGSDDGTLAFLRQLPPSVTWLSEADNGQSDALNKARKLAHGDWLGWLNADEFYLPGALDAVMRTFEISTSDVLFGDFIEVDRDGRFLRLVPEHRFSAVALKARCFIPSCTVFFRSDVLPLSPWRTDCRTVMDWDLYLRLARDGARFGYLRRPIAAFTRHSGQVSELEQNASRPAEVNAVFARCGLPSAGARRRLNGFFGEITHIGLKVADGSYARQIRARRVLAGERIAVETTDERRRLQDLLARAYPLSSAT